MLDVQDLHASRCVALNCGTCVGLISSVLIDDHYLLRALLILLSLYMFATHRRAEYAQSTSKRILSELQAGTLDL